MEEEWSEKKWKKNGVGNISSRLYKKSTTKKKDSKRERVHTLYYVFRPETPLLLFKNDGRRRRRKKLDDDDDGRMDPVRATAGG